MTFPPLGVGTAPAGYVVGVDIGGTKTHSASARPEPASGQEVREFVVPSSSWRGDLGAFEADGVALRNLLVDQFGEDVLGAPLAVGAHGCDNTGQCRALERALSLHFAGPVLVLNDSELMAPAMGVRSGIGVVVGTGSIAAARSATGALVAVGGWGWLLGDEGSAPGLVREAVRSVLGQLDRGSAVDTLGERLLASFGAHDGTELALVVSQAESAEAWGAHAPEVFAAADEGSVIADAIIRNAGEQLALLVDRLLQRGIDADAVVAGGSVIERQPRLQEELRAALARHRLGVALTILDRAPVTGAVALAKRIARETTTNTFRTENSST